MLEAFLINPHRVKTNRTKRRTIGKSRRRRVGRVGRRKSGGLPSSLLSRMIKQYGAKRGMKEAWREYRGGARRNTFKGHPKAHGDASARGWNLRRVHKRGYAKQTGATYPRWNPFGEEVMIVGANPGRKRKRTRRNLSLNRKRRVVHRRRRRVYALNPWRRRRSVYYSHNRRRRRGRRRYLPMLRNRAIRSNRRRRRHYRRNPAFGGGLPAMSIRRPMSLLIPMAIGAGGYMAADLLPAKLNMVDTFPRLGVKAAVAIGGSMVLSKFMGRSNGTIFMIGAGINLFQDLLKTFVFKTAVAGLGGYGAYVHPGGYGAYTEAYDGYGGDSPY